jgi:hypothetical protein
MPRDCTLVLSRTEMKFVDYCLSLRGQASWSAIGGA